ncbi:conserved Plasmodium protein, unknown function [Plasmodium knowlesi strain H]|uniref:Uncharacterized protein n=3 Tax=Plasmodium knowlesi TaxID=5850 RepID=A0A5K1V3P0_PLAKH|nr:conserved Plasmodium protein, unknown function [Plasmodium knowlesi strain H]OTN65442.1 Uncharacterized protein PKNOH_S110083600 [Plasmodium knowlesi]CAA9989458.1 conserved Plasmodium protein, unknown function [Plasmodium knowlesi strain H]SBO25101.1 conserved Plasmodium protein, unknown function [Plasmodium knowlesi strain H]SBO27815.1 conserved Plasmodium protein, unknown function [Plasmodium knowlesi strain H]VVS78932.1 conserved Plasmodium protein, unknown function [Plasmodium knowlesi |eukprot:XP_002260184.1 hypothetical protein, conserved in Plasmodium species [Plasmodium knowlesi strain H]
MQTPSLFSKKISVFCKFRRNIFNSINRNDETPNLSTIHLSTSLEGEEYAREDETNKYEGAVDREAHLCNEEHIPYNLIREKDLYGVNLNVDIFLLKNNNIVFFLHNVINIYNPVIKSLRSLFTKNDYVITCSVLHEDSLIVVLYGSARCSCIQIYCMEGQNLKEEIKLDDLDFYEKIFVQKDNNYFVLITNKRILKVLDSEKKTFILNMYLHQEYCNIEQYYDFFLILRKKKLFLWNLERTYTGLKVKEKNLEIDPTVQVNCFGFCEKNILIGTSDGRLFLLKDLVEKWIIKNENGQVHFHRNMCYVHYYDGYITTKDGDSLKLWACEFNLASLSTQKELFVKLEKDVSIQVNISKIISHEKFFLLIDKKNCTIYSSKKNNYGDLSTFFYTHNSKIKNIFSWKNNIFSFSYNGKVFNYELDEKKMERNYCLHKFRDFITCVKYLYCENNFFFFCIGFNNGVIYIVKMKQLFLDVVTCVKTSNNPIIDIEKSECCKYICVISQEEEYVFFLYKHENVFKPLGYLRICETELRGSFYLPSTRSFYILGVRNLLFRVCVDRLAEHISDGSAYTSGEYPQSPHTPGGCPQSALQTPLPSASEENPYDLRIQYEILEVKFHSTEDESYLYASRGRKSAENSSVMDRASSHTEYSESEGDSPVNSSASDISEGEYEKMNFYRDKMSLTRGTEEEIEKKESSIQLSIFKNKRKNLQKYVETLFSESVMNKLEKRRKKYPTCLSVNLERDKRKEEEKENAEEEKKNKKNKLSTGKSLEINISCLAKMNDNGFVLTTEGIKNNCIFFLQLNGRCNRRYRVENDRRRTILRPTVVYKIARKNFPPRVSIVSMIVNEANHLLFCLTNHNNIFVFSTKYFFLYYRVKIPLYEKVRNIYVNEGEKKRQYIFVSLGNNYIKLDFHFFFVHLFNVLKRYHVSAHRWIQRFGRDTQMEKSTSSEMPHLTMDSLYQFFIEEIHDYIVEKFVTKKKKKKNIIPFTLEDIRSDVAFLMQLFKNEQRLEGELSGGTRGGIPEEETTPKNPEDDKGRSEGNEIMDIWNFIQNNNKEEEKEKIEEQKKKINLILNYDQRNMITIFNTNEAVQDEDILYSLREMKEAKENEENVKRALLHKKNMNMKINKLKKKYTKFLKKKKFLIDVDMSKRIYKHLKDKIKEYEKVFTYNQREYDERIRYLIRTYQRLKCSRHTLTSHEMDGKAPLTMTCIKMYLKNNRLNEFVKKKKKKSNKRKIKNEVQLMNEVNQCLHQFNDNRQKNQKLKIVNNEEKIEEICQKKKIIKMYEHVLAQLDQMEKAATPPRPPRRISSITEIISKYEEDKRKLVHQINFIKEMFNEDFRAVMSQMEERMAQMHDEVLFLKEALKKEKAPCGKAEQGEGMEPEVKSACPSYDQMESPLPEMATSPEMAPSHSKQVDTTRGSEKAASSMLNHLEQFILKKKGTCVAKIKNINFERNYFERKNKDYKKEQIERQLEKIRKKFAEEVRLLHMKKVEAIRIIKFISLKIVSIDEKNSILMQLRKREVKLKKQRKVFTKELSILDNQMNTYIQEMQMLVYELDCHNEQKDKNLQRVKEMIGEDSLCYKTLIKGLRKNQDEASDESDGGYSKGGAPAEEEDDNENPATKCAELGQTQTQENDQADHVDDADQVDPLKKNGLNKTEQIEKIKRENMSILNGINNIKKNIEYKKNEQRKLLTKKKNIEKEVHMLNEEMKVIEEDKKKYISQVKFYILVKFSKLRNIDYLYDKKKYRLNLSSQCAIISREQYRDIIEKMEKLIHRKEELTKIYTTLKRENAELEHVNNKLYKNMNDKKNALKNKLKKHDLIFDFNDLEKKYQEKKKKGIIQEIKNTEIENNRYMNLLHKELAQKNNQLNEVRRHNTLLLEKINQYIQVLKVRTEQNESVG